MVATTHYEEQLEPVIHRVAAEVPIEGPKAQHFVNPETGRILRRTRGIALAARALSVLSPANVIFIVPENVAWLVGRVDLKYQASATVGSRVITARVQDSSSTEQFRTGELTATVNQTARFVLETHGGIDTSANLNYPESVKLTCVFPSLPIPPGWRFMIFDNSAIDTADTIAVLGGIVDEFPLPRGLGRDETPMGLESGFMWDLADPRKVD